MYVPDFCATEAEFPSAEAVRINLYVWPRRNFLFEPFQVRHHSTPLIAFSMPEHVRSIQRPLFASTHPTRVTTKGV